MQSEVMSLDNMLTTLTTETTSCKGCQGCHICISLKLHSFQNFKRQAKQSAVGSEMYQNSSSLLFKIIWFSWVLFASTQLVNAMDFRWAGTGGNCVGCAWIVAEGEITRETPQKFKKFLKEEDPGAFIVVLNSPGGNLFGGIELGRIIRENGFHTKVGKSYRPKYVKQTTIVQATLRNLMLQHACLHALTHF